MAARNSDSALVHTDRVEIDGPLVMWVVGGVVALLALMARIIFVMFKREADRHGDTVKELKNATRSMEERLRGLEHGLQTLKPVQDMLVEASKEKLARSFAPGGRKK